MPPDNHPPFAKPGTENDRNNTPNKVSTAPRCNNNKLLADAA